MPAGPHPVLWLAEDPARVKPAHTVPFSRGRLAGSRENEACIPALAGSGAVDRNAGANYDRGVGGDDRGRGHSLEHRKLLERVLRGSSDANVGFEEMRRLLLGLGFQERIRGSHHIFTKDGIEEILNLQPKTGSAKAYQVRQVRSVLLRYRLGGEDDV